MSISSAIQWWEEWQLRILVLGSLFFHLFLSFSHLVRQFPRLRKLRALVWIAYLGNDALAIYALATLFNRHQELTTTDGGSRNSALELVWAPVLLIHLGGGGPNAITAYSIEDNDLWRRHAMTVVSQVTVALYVLCRWWFGEKRLLMAAVLLFAAGILESISKTWALRKASFNTMLASTAVPPQREDGCLISACWRWCNSSCISDDMLQRRKAEPRILSLEGYVQEAIKQGVQGAVEASNQEMKHDKISVIGDTINKFVDLPAQYSDRIFVLEYFMKLNGSHSYGVIRSLLDDMFRRLYTKRKAGATPIGAFLIGLHIALVVASLVLFATSSNDGYNDKDVLVTYILLCCAALQFFVHSMLNLLASPFRNLAKNSTWYDNISQCNLLSFCAREMQPTVEMRRRLSEKIFHRPCINKHRYVWLVPEALPITELVHKHLITFGWKHPKYSIHDVASYRRFNNLRGQLTLQMNHQLERMGWSLDMPFDQSVLVWHIATNLCFHMSQAPHPVGQEVIDPCKNSRVISNYMLYMLFIRPDMLLPGTRQDLFMIAGGEVQSILMGRRATFHNEKIIAEEIFNAVDKTTVTATATATATSIAPHSITTSSTVTATTTGTPTALGIIIPDACRLAKALMKRIGNETERWKVIQGVWVEMLCYSAARCRGYLHARSLGEGCEYLSIVWLLWSHMGMETLAEMTQKQEPIPMVQEEDPASGH